MTPIDLLRLGVERAFAAPGFWDDPPTAARVVGIHQRLLRLTGVPPGDARPLPPSDLRVVW